MFVVLFGLAVGLPIQAAADRRQPVAVAASSSPSTGATSDVTVTRSATGGTNDIDFLGVRFQTPDAWPVVDLALDPEACVRFDQSAVYVGHPGDAQQCPSKMRGSADGLLIEPFDAVTSAAQIPGTITAAIGAPIELDKTQLASHAVRVILPDVGVVISGSFNDSPDALIAVIEGVTGSLGSTPAGTRSTNSGSTGAGQGNAGTASPTNPDGTTGSTGPTATPGDETTDTPRSGLAGTPSTSAPTTAAPSNPSSQPSAVAGSGFAPASGAIDVPRLAASVAAVQAPAGGLTSSVFQGHAIDVCMAPSLAAMTGWRSSSPYGAANIYIGGNNVGCRRSANPNLTSTWVAKVAQMGWWIIPTYTGYQVAGGDCSSCGAVISRDPRTATSQGISDAQDAIVNAQSLGIGPGNPLFFDLEAYYPGPNTTPTAMVFLSAWTNTLHAAGYTSGVYSSLSSGIADMKNYLGSPGYTPPDQIWMASWKSSGYSAARTVWDFTTVPNSLWSNHQRIYQYAGDHAETWGGYSLRIDSNVADSLLTSTPRMAATPWGNKSIYPFGSLDSVSLGTNTITANGWAIDPDTTSGIPVDITIDGVLKLRASASINRPDLVGVAPGYGSAHGYRATVSTISLAGGPHTVCAYGINVSAAGDVEPGGNTQLGCRVVTLPSDPLGTLDSVVQTPGGLRVNGWAFDPDSTGSTQIHVYVDGNWGGLGQTSTARPDVAAAFPLAGANAGFSFDMPVAAGTHKVCAYAINRGAGTVNPSLGCRTVYLLGPNPFGNNETFTRSGGRFMVSGWTLDPSTMASANVKVTVDGAVVSSTAASVLRADVWLAYPYFGAAHGFSVNVAAPSGSANVCVAWQSTDGSGRESTTCRTL